MARGDDHVARVEARPARRLDDEAAGDHVEVGRDQCQAALAALEHERAGEQAGVLAERAGVAARPAEHRVAGRGVDVGAAGAGAQAPGLGAGAGRRHGGGEEGGDASAERIRAIVCGAG